MLAPTKTRLRPTPEIGAAPVRPPRPTLAPHRGMRAWAGPRPANTLSFRLSQPGLASWWRLAAPSLQWVLFLLGHMSWVAQRLRLSTLSFRGHRSRARLDFLPPRARLVTFTRGPMARKKGSRVQFTVAKRLVQYRLVAKAPAIMVWADRTPPLLLATLAAEQAIWMQGLPSPLLLQAARSRTTIWAPAKLLWA